MSFVPKRPVPLTPELADALIEPILERLELEVDEDEDDQVARSLAGIICALASEADPDMRAMFAEDLIKSIYSKTAAINEAAEAFARFAGGKYLQLVA
jgi:hypothetical protein